jgi:hypothetical protein
MTRLRTVSSDGSLDVRVALGVVIGAVLLAGCASSSPQPAGPLRPRTGPASPALGTPYPYDLFTHCGIHDAYFENRWWEADSPTLDDPSKGSNPYTGSLAGTMTLTSPTAARFDGPHQLAATFHPLDGTPQACS